MKDHTTQNGGEEDDGENSGEGPQKCAKSLLIPCVFFFSSTPTFILPHHFLVRYGGKEVWMRRADVWMRSSV